MMHKGMWSTDAHKTLKISNCLKEKLITMLILTMATGFNKGIQGSVVSGLDIFHMQ